MGATIIVNPAAGGRRSGLRPEDRLRMAHDAIRRHGVDGRVVMTERVGHGTELARRAVDEGCDLVVAWGGDGTINEVASALVHGGAALGVVRSGSGNGLARALGIPKAPDRALDIALTGCDRALDVGEIDGRWFLNLAGIGFDATMATAFNRLGADHRGPVRYAVAVARMGFGYRSVEYTIAVDGDHLEVDALLVVVANLSQYGANAVIAPDASPDDGVLDLVVIGARGALGRIGLIPRLFDRTIPKAAGVIARPVRRLTIRSSAPMAFHVDGEPYAGGTTLEAQVHAGALRVRTPRLDARSGSR